MMRIMFMALVLLAVMVSVTSCNMFRGAGRDVQSVGEAMENAGR